MRVLIKKGVLRPTECVFDPTVSMDLFLHVCVNCKRYKQCKLMCAQLKVINYEPISEYEYETSVCRLFKVDVIF